MATFPEKPSRTKKDADHEDSCKEYGLSYEKYRTREEGVRAARKREVDSHAFHKVIS